MAETEGRMSALNDYLQRSAAALTAMAERDLTGEMERAADVVVEALRQGKAFLICGNGGSASDAIHIAGELVGRFLKERKAYNVIALPANAAVLTAWGNDYGFDTVFSRQVEAHGAAGGVLLAISTSGNSPSILAAAEQARMMDMTVISLTGDTGGKLKPLSDILLNVPSTSTPIIQQGHLCLYHYLCEVVEARLSNG
jgi:D-sedoheptulose 7-phosphate isomerase